MLSSIKGNTLGAIQTKVSEQNGIGETINTWSTVVSTHGVLGLQSGDSKYINFDAKIEESTHVFTCEFNTAIYALANQDTRMVIKGKMYDVLLIDNPDELDAQLEIYLKFVGGQNG